MRRDPVWIGVGGGMVAALLLVPMTGGALERLAAARRARTEAADASAQAACAGSPRAGLGGRRG